MNSALIELCLQRSSFDRVPLIIDQHPLRGCCSSESDASIGARKLTGWSRKLALQTAAAWMHLSRAGSFGNGGRLPHSRSTPFAIRSNTAGAPDTATDFESPHPNCRWFERTGTLSAGGVRVRVRHVAAASVRADVD